MQKVSLFPRVHSHDGAISVSRDLTSCTHVFVRRDAIRKPLQQPYDGPYKVLARADQFFMADVNGLHDTISLDHLEPAYSDKAL